MGNIDHKWVSRGPHGQLWCRCCETSLEGNLLLACPGAPVRPKAKIRMSPAAWAAGYWDARDGRPDGASWHSGWHDPLAYAAGYLEGKAARDKKPSEGENMT